MRAFIVWRLGLAVGSMLAMSLILFFGVAGFLGTPAAILLGAEDATADALNELNERLGFNRPLIVQYFDWLGNILTGDFGVSYSTKLPVIEMILPRIPVTIEVGALALVLATVLSVLVNSLPSTDRFSIRPVVDALSIGGITLPNFILGTFLIYGFAVYLNVLPSIGWAPWSEGVGTHLYHLILPVTTLAAYAFGATTIVYQAEFDSMSKQPFARIARGKGLSRGAVAFKHVLPNSILPVVSLFGVNMGQLLGGAIVTETLFSIPGLGTLFVESIMGRDYSLMLALGLLMIVGVIIVSSLTDIAYTYINPQIRIT
jgi:peptide/nickel transport system permease protein